MSYFQIRSVIAVTMPLLLGACGLSDVAQLTEQTIKPIDYRSHLAANYRRLTIFESEQMMDHVDAELFARKGLAALHASQPPQPEDPARWSIASDRLPAIAAARRQLMTALSLNLAKPHPQAMAEAVTALDCWIEQAEEGWQIADIAACKQRFRTALQQLTADSGYHFNNDGSAQRRQTLYYPVNQAALGIGATIQLDAVLAKLPSDRQVAVKIIGHADRLGSEAYNHGLSQRRALGVHQRLIDLGAPAHALGVSWRGEKLPEVRTADNLAEPRNRRTEITWTIHPGAQSSSEGTTTSAQITPLNLAD